jgi:polyferredoxin
VDKVKTVLSDECTTCLSCVDACPVADTLYVRSLITKKKVPKKKIAVAIVLIFMAVTGLGMITHHWRNDITRQEYLIHYKYMDSYGHPTGTAAVKKFNKDANSGLSNKSSELKLGKVDN